MLFANFHQI